MLLNGKEQVHFWRELERVERWLSTRAGAAVGRVYDSMGRPGEQTFAHYGNQLVAGSARVDRVREALDQSAPIAKRLVMQQLSGIGLSAVWDILIAACKEIALYYGGAVVTGAVVGGALGSLAFGVGAAPGAVIGTAAGSQVGIWVLALLGLKELAEGLGKMFPAAMEHYERGFREAWGAMPENRRETWNSPALPTGNSSAGAWQMAQGNVILVTAILTALVAYLTRGRGTKAVLMQDIRNSPRLGPRFADWLAENEGRLLAQPQLQSRPNNSVAMAVGASLPSNGRGGAAARSKVSTGAIAANNPSAGLDVPTSGDTVTVFRVQGGTPPQASRKVISIDVDGNPVIQDTTLNISIGDASHAAYFQTMRPNGTVTSFDIPKWMDEFIQENAIPQLGYRNNPLNQGGLAPKLLTL